MRVIPNHIMRDSIKGMNKFGILMASIAGALVGWESWSIPYGLALALSLVTLVCCCEVIALCILAGPEKEDD